MEYTVNVEKPKDDTERAISGELTVEVQRTEEKDTQYFYTVIGKGTLTNLISPFTNGSERSVVEKPTIGPVEILAPFNTFSISKAGYDRGDTGDYELAIIDNLDYLLLLLRKEFEKTFGIAMNFKLEWKVKKTQTAPAENKEKPKVVAKWLSTSASSGGRPLEIGFEVFKDGESIIKRENTAGFTWDQTTKKISLKAADLFYNGAGKWLEGFGKEPFIEKDIILILENFPGSTSTAVAESGTTGTSGTSGTSAKLIEGEYKFDVTTTGFLVNAELGKLKIISKEEVDIVDEFLPGEEEVQFEVSEEYRESEFTGPEESFESVVVEEFNSNTKTAVDLTETNAQLDFTAPTNNETPPAEVPSDSLKPTKKGFLQGKTFAKTQGSGNTWDVKVSETYKLTKFKYGNPKITESSFIKRVKKAEGGVANGTSDNAYRTYGDKTVCPISKKDHPNAKKYNSLCTSETKGRIYNIHTNKGILWLVFKTAFGVKNSSEHGSESLQKRFLEMSDEDWWKVMNDTFVKPNRGLEMKSKVAGYFYTYLAWGSGSGGSIKNLNNTLNLLKGSKDFSSGKITDAHIKYVNELYDQGKEWELISALYDCRAQFLLNISQPGNKNSVYRNGWINGVNAWIQDFHES
jgi:hypothetical protein